MAQLHRVVVLDRTTGICLFERAWPNATPVTSVPGFCKLVLTFFMMSRELNDGGVSFVLFDKPERKIRPGQVRLALARNDHVIVGALHEPSENEAKVQRTIEALLAEFSSKFADRLSQQRGSLTELASEKGDHGKLALEDVQKSFSELGQVLDQPIASPRGSQT